MSTRKPKDQTTRKVDPKRSAAAKRAWKTIRRNQAEAAKPSVEAKAKAPAKG
jgi:hypothetical protein